MIFVQLPKQGTYLLHPEHPQRKGEKEKARGKDKGKACSLWEGSGAPLSSPAPPPPLIRWRRKRNNLTDFGLEEGQNRPRGPLAPRALPPTKDAPTCPPIWGLQASHFTKRWYRDWPSFLPHRRHLSDAALRVLSREQLVVSLQGMSMSNPQPKAVSATAQDITRFCPQDYPLL